MKTILPHDLFRLDFDKMATAGEVQEGLHSANAGEAVVSKELHAFFAHEVLPQIKQDPWVFEAARIFAEEFAVDCFQILRLTGNEIYSTQQKLLKIKDEIKDFVARAWIAGYEGKKASTSKLRDFTEMIDMARLPPAQRRQADRLVERAIDHDNLQVEVALRSIRDQYEREFPRIFFVVRRALTVTWNLRRKKGNDSLQQPSNYADWYQAVAPPRHVVNRWITKHWDFYKTARNVSSHHTGLKWNPEQNLVILEDRGRSTSVDLDVFFQRNRYLVYFCDLGVRGILAAFAERERGPISNHLVKEYSKSFPENWEGGKKGKVSLYPVQEQEESS